MVETKNKSAIPAYQRTSYEADEVRGKLRLVIIALLAVSILYGKYYHVLGCSNPEFVSITERVLYTIKLQVFSAIPIFVSLQHVMLQRIRNPLLHNPLSGNDAILEKSSRILSNTIEQYLLHLINILVFAVVVPSYYNYFIRYLVFCFVLGRALFFAGYLIHPKHRGYGFIITYMPTVVVFGYNLLKVSGIF